jgi:hypothetical protein
MGGNALSPAKCNHIGVSDFLTKTIGLEQQLVED